MQGNEQDDRVVLEMMGEMDAYWRERDGREMGKGEGWEGGYLKLANSMFMPAVIS